MAESAPKGDGFQVWPKALRSPIAMGMRAAQIQNAGALELRPAKRIQRPKPTMKAEIA